MYIGIYAQYEGIVKRVEEVAKKRGISMAQVALAWVIAKPGVTAPIVGTRSLENLKDLIGGFSMRVFGGFLID